MSPINSRAKGVKGERQVADIWRTDGGAEIRGLEGTGDHLVIYPARAIELVGPLRPVESPAVLIHSESKRQERLQLPIWLRQAAGEAPAGAIPVVSFRQNRGDWYACLPLVDLAKLVAR